MPLETCNFENSYPVVGSIELARDLLGEKYPVVFFDLNLTEEEKVAIDSLDVKEERHFETNFYGNLKEEYGNYLHDIGNDNVISSYVSNIVNRIAEAYHKIKVNGFSGASILIVSNAASPDFYNSPVDWHIDNNDKTPDSLEYRMAVALKGEGTMFCKLSKNEEARLDSMNIVDQKYYNLANSNITNESDYISFISTFLNPCDTNKGHSIYSPPSYHGALFVTGKTNYSSIHSAPEIKDKRIFLSFW